MAATANAEQEDFELPPEVFNDEEAFLDEDEDDDDVVLTVRGSSRQRGRPSDRQKAALDQPLEQCYKHYGIILPTDQTDEER
jgi:hypothetical protein